MPTSVRPWHSFSGDWLLRVIVLRLENGEQAWKAKPKPELEPTVQCSGVYHYAIKTTMSPEKENKRKGERTARVMDGGKDGCAPNFTQTGPIPQTALSPPFFVRCVQFFPR